MASLETLLNSIDQSSINQALAKECTDHISENERRLIDRCHNVSSMAGTFSVEKLKSYIEETRHYVLPLLRKVKNQYPEDSDILFVLKYHIVSVVDSIDATIQVFEAEK
ncbi:MAG: hypothetical protein MR426_08430 [Clostridiales bacterium]|nr:hypothetical protein [Clostridiales bacterium]